MNPKYILKSKLYWEVENPKMIETLCSSCNGSGSVDNWDDFPYITFEKCSFCVDGKVLEVDPDQYPKIDPDLELAIQKLIDGRKLETCVWRKQGTVESKGKYFTKYECCKHSRGRYTTVKAVVPHKCTFCNKTVELENY